MTHMIPRILKKRLTQSHKSTLLLGPRQVGKSTLCRELKPDLSINFADQEQFKNHLKDPALLKRMVRDPDVSLILIDEVQRLPEILNTVQFLIDTHPQKRFILTGSSARKLKRGNANLIPGRIIIMHLSPLLFWELEDNFDLHRALTLGCLPDIYLHDTTGEVLQTYANTYLREEIQAEALTKNLASYSRFLDLASLKSGEQINYSKLSSLSEISKESIRRYFQILEDTLIVHRIPSYTDVTCPRRVQQKDKFVFFDLGVRNSILNLTNNRFLDDELGHLFEQWLIIQVIGLNSAENKNWAISQFRTDQGDEVDLIIETAEKIIAIEIKYGTSIRPQAVRGLNLFASGITHKPIDKLIAYRGQEKQFFECGTIALNYQTLLKDLRAI